MRINCRGVGDQSVERDERRNCGKDRQQRIEDDAGGDGKQSVIVDARIDAPKNILPTCPRDFPRSRRAPPAPTLLRPVQLRGDRLIVLNLLERPFVGFRRRGEDSRWVSPLLSGAGAPPDEIRGERRDFRYRASPRSAHGALRRSRQERHRAKAAIYFDVPPSLSPRSLPPAPVNVIGQPVPRNKIKLKKDERGSRRKLPNTCPRACWMALE